MANIRLNPALMSLRGKIGDLVFKKLNGESYVARRPERTNRIPSDAQKAVQQRFREATVFGKTVMADAQARALYEAAARNRKKPTFSLMVADFFSVPEVSEIDLSTYDGQAGSTIGIRANDDIMVMSVDVTITNGSGTLFERGAAARSAQDAGRWTYTATTSIPAGTPLHVEVIATDRPGNKGTKIANA